MVEASNRVAFLRGKVDCVGKSGKTSGFYSREWPRGKARFRWDKKVAGTFWEESEKAYLRVRAEVTV